MASLNGARVKETDALRPNNNPDLGFYPLGEGLLRGAVRRQDVQPFQSAAWQNLIVVKMQRST